MSRHKTHAIANHLEEVEPPEIVDDILELLGAREAAYSLCGLLLTDEEATGLEAVTCGSCLRIEKTYAAAVPAIIDAGPPAC